MNKRTNFVFSIFVISVVFVSILRSGDSLRCFECNSHWHKSCGEKSPPKNFTKDCENKGQNPPVCRKIVQTIDFEVNGLPPDSRVIRACAYERQEINKCYQRSGFGGRQEVCACDTDECNGSNLIKFNYFTFFFSFVSICFVGYRLL